MLLKRVLGQAILHTWTMLGRRSITMMYVDMVGAGMAGLGLAVEGTGRPRRRCLSAVDEGARDCLSMRWFPRVQAD